MLDATAHDVGSFCELNSYEHFLTEEANGLRSMSGIPSYDGDQCDCFPLDDFCSDIRDDDIEYDMLSRCLLLEGEVVDEKVSMTATMHFFHPKSNVVRCAVDKTNDESISMMRSSQKKSDIRAFHKKFFVDLVFTKDDLCSCRYVLANDDDENLRCKKDKQ